MKRLLVILVVMLIISGCQGDCTNYIVQWEVTFTDETTTVVDNFEFYRVEKNSSIENGMTITFRGYSYNESYSGVKSVKRLPIISKGLK